MDQISNLVPDEFAPASVAPAAEVPICAPATGAPAFLPLLQMMKHLVVETKFSLRTGETASHGTGEAASRRPREAATRAAARSRESRLSHSSREI